ncbi:MAG TPA: hypothetical protein VN700_09450 [Vicinamibacterales bacterium]|nr:hypothetical protein [Vicinamibacterales bacterium]
MSNKGELRFQLSLPGRLGRAGLPIEVRRENRSLVGRFDAGDNVVVDPGAYYVSVRLPNGDEVTDWVHIDADSHATAQLVAAPGEDPDAFESQSILTPALQTNHRMEVRMADPDHISEASLDRLTLRRTVAPNSAVGIRAWRGTIGQFVPMDASTLTVETRPALTWILVSATAGEQVVLQLVVPGRPGIVLVVPNQPGGPPVRVTLTRSGDELTFDAHLNNELADLVIRDSTEIERRKRIGNTMELRGLLQEKSSDAVAAAAGAVGLLGIDEAERVHSWLINLANWFPWLPDGAALAAESCARNGQDEEAVRFLSLLEHRGLPLFSDSLAFALDRLRRYERSKTELIGDRKMITRIRRRLQPYAEFGVSGRALTTFRAVHPNHPGDERFDTIPADARTITAPIAS